MYKDIWRALAVAALVLAGGAGVRAQDAERFYAGRALTLVTSFTPGGLNDIAGRLVARHLGRFLPGTPTINVQNMPGAGGLVAANYLYNVAARDGSIIGQLDRSVAQSGIRGAANVKFDALKFTWLGSLSTYGAEAYIMWVNARYPAEKVADLDRSGTRARLGAVTGGTNHLISLVAQKVLGLNIEVIAGYPGAGAIWLAMRNGELDGQIIGITSVKAEHPELWRERALRGLVQFGRADRLADFADLPTGRELAKTDDDRALVAFAELPFLTSLPFVAPPDTPADRARALREAFMRMVADAEFIAEAARLNVELSPRDGQYISDIIERSATIPRGVIERYNAITDVAK